MLVSEKGTITFYGIGVEKNLKKERILGEKDGFLKHSS